jgi:hypothetical protein
MLLETDTVHYRGAQLPGRYKRNIVSSHIRECLTKERQYRYEHLFPNEYKELCTTQYRTCMFTQRVLHAILQLTLNFVLKVYTVMKDLRFSRRWLWWMASSVMLHRVALVRTDDSEVFLRSVRRLLVRASDVPSSPILITLMKEALRSSERSVELHGVTS